MNRTPNCPKGAYEFRVTLDDVDLVCHLDYLPAEKGSRGSFGEPLEPSSDEDMDLFSVYVAGTDADIKSLMAYTYWDQIERLALIAYNDKAP